jgi:acyl-CoA synthetase (AMP-forming)/AMP-acid ligase II
VEFNLSEVVRAVADAVPDREAIVQDGVRRSFAELVERADRLAAVLATEGLGCHRERSELSPWESGQDHLALYLHNGPEYLEGMLGAYAARVAPFNVNYRYVAEELEYLLRDAGARAVLYHSAFAPVLTEVRPRLEHLDLLLQVPDASGHELLDGARWYEDALAAAGPPPQVTPSPDDLYILYTGGTTGMPKGVLWRQGDIYPAALGGRQLSTGEEWPDLAAIAAAAADGGARVLPAAPFMHGAAHWLALNALGQGNTVVLPDDATHFDAAAVWSTVEREQVGIVLVVGDAFGRPLLDELDRHQYDASSLVLLISGGAALSAPIKAGLLERIPGMAIMDGLGSSETGTQASHFSAAGTAPTTGTFTPGPGAAVVSDDLQRVLAPGDDELGWLAQRGRVPLGYLGDEAKTERTFPVIGGERVSVPGDRARLRPDGLVELHGRDSVTINTGGEKVFAEEVEAALVHHPAVYDAVVAGRPSARWGQEVVAVVQLREGARVGAEELLGECERHVARFKLPKEIVFVDRVVRSPAGKADYRWARSVAEATAGEGPATDADAAGAR